MPAMLPRQRPHEAETVLDETLARGSEGLRRKESGGCSQDEQIRVREDETTRAHRDRDCALGQLHTHTLSTASSASREFHLVSPSHTAD